MLYFFFNDTATTEIYTLSLHDALPIYRLQAPGRVRGVEVALGLLKLCGREADYAHAAEGGGAVGRDDGDRSEEHTSDLQSRQYLVCRLLLEKKTPTRPTIRKFTHTTHT